MQKMNMAASINSRSSKEKYKNMNQEIDHLKFPLTKTKNDL